MESKKSTFKKEYTELMSRQKKLYCGLFNAKDVDLKEKQVAEDLLKGFQNINWILSDSKHYLQVFTDTRGVDLSSKNSLKNDM